MAPPMRKRRPAEPGGGRLTRRVITGPNGLRQPVEVDLAESPLAWLRSRRDKGGEPLIDDREFEAGERFRRDYTIGGLVQRTTMNWDAFGMPASRRPGGPGGGVVIADAAMAARARVNRAIEAVGPDLSGVLVDICCELKGLADVERDHRWPSRSGKVVLRLALSALARHYGLDERAVGPERGRSRHWGTDDFRPAP